MKKLEETILSYREMCDKENKQTLQRGMNFRLNPRYSVILMSQRSNAPYKDRIHADGITIEYEGHDVNKKNNNPKEENQPDRLPSGKLTQNGYFINSIISFKKRLIKPELVKVYEKIMNGVWSFKGFFDLIDYKTVNDGKRDVFRFILRLSENQGNEVTFISAQQISHARLIPSEVKKEVWKRDKGRCVLCDETKNLHFDHDLPFSKGGTSLTSKNIRLLCIKHNLSKSGKIE